jgi:hypothetical protein
MRRFLSVMTVVFFCFLAVSIPFAAATVEHYCPMFKPEHVQRWNQSKNTWESLYMANGYLVGAIVLGEISCVIITVSALLGINNVRL